MKMAAIGAEQSAFRRRSRQIMREVGGIASLAAAAGSVVGLAFALGAHSPRNREHLTSREAAESRFIFDFTHEGGCLDESVYAQIDQLGSRGQVVHEMRNVSATGPDTVLVKSVGQIPLKFIGLKDPSSPLQPSDKQTEDILGQFNCDTSIHDGPA